jgi:carbon-monoxide dehydrogenase medium subunit
MTPFELVTPHSLSQAIDLLDPENPSTRPIAGGTALMLMMKAGVFRPQRLVSLTGIEPRYSSVEMSVSGLRIGAVLTLAQLERSVEVQREAPVIGRTLRTLSNIRVRNVATVGGHLAHADPHMDLPPVLIALGGQVLIVGPSGSRLVPVEELYVGYFETILARNELIAELVIPRQTRRRSAYVKCTTRAAHDWPALGVAVSLESDAATIREANIVLSAATEKPSRLAAAEKVMRGGRIGETLLRDVAEAAAEEAAVIGDIRGSAAYKKRLVRVYVERALQAALTLNPEKGLRH